MISRLNIRQSIEQKEDWLSPCAARSALSRGRQRGEDPSPLRTDFQRDRDRIIHCRAFRRLKHKTQVFIAPLDDHYVTRLTHTLEVSQIARTIARALNLNEDLTEAISLGHDLGHTPFGHIGEEVLNELYHEGFRHAEQSLRVVDLLEKDGEGLNLTWETRNGIASHSKEQHIFGKGGNMPGTLEGEVCRVADAIAYINHDIVDAVRAGIIREEDLPVSAVNVLGETHSRRINTMVTDLVESSWTASGRVEGSPAIQMSSRVREASDTMRDFLFEKVYRLRSAQDETERAKQVVSNLFNYVTTHTEILPAEYRMHTTASQRMAVDYIAGMTDNYAIRMAENIAK